MRGSARIRVADLLTDPLLDGAVTLAGHGGLERPVTDVSRYTATGREPGAAGQGTAGPAAGGEADAAGEPEPPGVEGHLLVCDDTQVTPPHRLDALVRGAQEAGAAALLVAAGRTRPLLSGMRLADRLGIPLLWLERAEPATLLFELGVRIRAHELTRARTVLALVRQLTAKKTGRDILAAAERILAVPLSLVTSDGTPILGEPVTVPPGLRLDLPVPQSAAHLLVHPVHDQEGNRAAAWLAITLERADADRTETLGVALAVAEPFVRSWLTGQRARAGRDAVFQTGLLAEIMAARDTVSRDVVENALSLGWRLQDWHAGIHLTMENSRAREDRDSVLGQHRDGLARHGVHTVAVVDRGDGWALWTSGELEPRPEEARQLLRALRVVITGLPRSWGLVAGIGRARLGPGGLAETLTEARDAASLARSHAFRPAVEHADELGVARLLATWQRSEVTRAFAETALAPLRDREHAHLLDTLRTFLESGGSAVATAQTLGVHRNTVGARVRQIRERLGVDLDDPSQRLALQMACRALDAHS
ncbi:PucR family transcriptional regulator [Streptomyces iconiensis]|uniref:Helix-turn-helix domain-containing protein n=1 Tax=Streptomyces iconiensis TaxID=1384038 RepID=A0ABT7A6Y7_9ACTN|nr:PucR family transcriptional regulator [Streptomyces iconiensis]MDJ1137105.1 helix-turn-helix domain-containing protein [Streptomyces iconiensis]